MAIKAICYVQDCTMDHDGNLELFLSIQTPEGGDGSVRFGPVKPELATLNDDLRTFVKQYATSKFKVTFDPILDKVRLLNEASIFT